MFRQDERDIPRLYQLVADAGVRWVRDEFDRQSINPRPGQYDWRLQDLVVGEAVRNGIELVGILCCTPDWDAVSPAPPSDLFFTSPPRRYDLWGDYVFQTVNRYKTRVHYWEIWNEPDLATQDFWAGTPAEFARVLAVASGEIRRADPSAWILLSGLAGGSFLDDIPDVTRRFLTAILSDRAFPAAQYFDIMNVHAYGTRSQIRAQMMRWREILNDLRIGNKPVWVTEMGWPSDPSQQAEDAAYCCGEAAQARYLTTVMPEFIDLGAQRVFWWVIWLPAPMDSQVAIEERLQSYGLLDYGFNPKPAYLALKALLTGPPTNGRSSPFLRPTAHQEMQAAHEPSSRMPPPSVSTILLEDGSRARAEIVALGLNVPTGLAGAPDGRIFVAERPGVVTIIEGDHVLPEAALTLDGVERGGQLGLLGLTLHPQFAQNHLVYLAYTAGDNPTTLRLVRYRELADRLAQAAVLLDEPVPLSMIPTARLRFGPDGSLYMAVGDTSESSSAQDLTRINGKVIRLNDDGSSPRDNRFAMPVFSYGYQNPSGFDWQPATHDLWVVDRRADGSDRVSIAHAGTNHGWGLPPDHPSIEPPVFVVGPGASASGLVFYQGRAFPTFSNSFLVGALDGEQVQRLRVDVANPRHVLEVEHLLRGYGRIGEVMVAPDGTVYAATSNRDGRGRPAAGDDVVIHLSPVTQ